MSACVSVEQWYVKRLKEGEEKFGIVDGMNRRCLLLHWAASGLINPATFKVTPYNLNDGLTLCF